MPGPEDAHPVLLDMRALEHPGHASQGTELADLADRDDVELAVVELRVRRDEHATAERLVVGDRDRVSGEAVALVVYPDREAAGPPSDQGADCGEGIDEVAAQDVGFV